MKHNLLSCSWVTVLQENDFGCGNGKCSSKSTLSISFSFPVTENVYNLREENKQLRKAHQDVHIQLQDARVRGGPRGFWEMGRGHRCLWLAGQIITLGVRSM